MKLPILIKTVAIMSIFLSFGCRADDVMKAEFRTLAECLKAIEKNTNSSLTIIRDKPEIVTGNLDNGKTFACERKESGTKGTYYEGWFMVD
ncbi:Uncharacterised protein [Serratia proteamaculans]|uniref:hypothetical protein n=1 Tax=Serratia proteamaculans TaxID=28151 RepID=UPI00124A8A4A|nr:hypothetical protein [Serratia proteamaculans]KAB1498446.1 hypothetical protein F8R23_03030 [Serratia proteamaculans]CAI0755177.1 Uncharacterised protein [Serratia proteamaculans]CAI0814312.1 Uncharacterised protein [Serratia proteamaculans]